jgi:transcriptional regulator with XRE-family HTH domain
MASNGNRIRELREKHELSRPELAVELGVDPSTLYRWETEGSEVPDEMKRRLAERFDVSREHLMGWDREPAQTGKAAA